MSSKAEPNPNMRIWEQVCKTDPKHTKHVSQRGGFTAICAQSRVKRATELWGPMGSSWGVEDEHFTIFEAYNICIYRAILFYPATDGKGMLPIHSSIFVSEKAKVDEDFVKKVATDALTKGLSKLGFSSDVFEGLYDDNRYVARMKAEFAEQEAKTLQQAPSHPHQEASLSDLPPMSKANVKSMNLIANWVSENVPNGKDISTASLAKLVYATLGHWPETPEDEKAILQTITIEKAAA
ncbi:MAG: hypothetical protein LLF76_02875 [Planctomycetaceae bacterium]|nr:hypothetical protein [Planctomycetaceae bacterium]